jgi:hypothetical protein
MLVRTHIKVLCALNHQTSGVPYLPQEATIFSVPSRQHDYFILYLTHVNEICSWSLYSA